MKYILIIITTNLNLYWWRWHFKPVALISSNFFVWFYGNLKYTVLENYFYNTQKCIPTQNKIIIKTCFIFPLVLFLHNYRKSTDLVLFIPVLPLTYYLNSLSPKIGKQKIIWFPPGLIFNVRINWLNVSNDIDEVAIYVFNVVTNFMGLS